MQRTHHLSKPILLLRAFSICILLAAIFSVLNHQQARAVALQDLVAPGTTVQQIGSGFGFIEGPVWHRDGYLLFSDTPRAQVMKWSPTAGISVYRQSVLGSNGLTFDSQNRLVIAEQDGRQVVREELNGALVTLASTYLNSKLNSPNDVAISADGSIYFTDPPYGLTNGTVGKELTFNGVFRLSPTGTLTLLSTEFDRPNGLAFSPNEKILYIADTSRSMVRAFDVLADGTISNSRLFASMTNPDGLKVDVNGNVWVAGGSGVLIYDPNGQQIGTISVPEQPSNIGFGDSDLKTLYITARTGLYKIRLLVAGIPHYGLRGTIPTVTATNISNPSTVRIEAGGTANFTDHNGNVWLSDRGFTVAAGGVADRGNITIANTLDPRIYQTERWGMTAFAYTVPNGTYQVNLHFAETYTGITAAGQRVFSANVEGTPINNIDVFAQTGGLNIALIKTVTVTVTDGQLNISFTATANNPEINGIEIIPVGPALTATATRTPTVTTIPTNTATRTATPTATNTLVASNTLTPTLMVSNTITATRTSTSTATNTPIAPTIRIEAGGIANFTDHNGNVWLTDQGFTVAAGGVTDRGNITIANTLDPRIYQTERWGMTAFAYTVPNGTYQVNLHFAETYTGITAAGQRVFSANVEGTPINNIDVFAQTGGLNIALIKTVTVTITDGQLNITFAASANNPEINGIEIIPAGPAPTATLTATVTKTLIPVNTPTPTVTPTITNTVPVTVTSTPTSTPSGVTVRIEAGGNANFVDTSGNIWLADTGFTAGAGGVADRGNIAIANTLNPRIYQTERWGMTAFAYPVTNGAYQVNLHFAETYTGITAAGQRVFSANVEGTAINNIDVFSQAGGLNKALVKSACVNVADGQLNITFAASVNNPEINGIEIIPGAFCPAQAYTGTPYSDTVYTGGAQPIPGRVKFAYYDFGGEGMAYHDMDAANQGSCGLNPCDGSYLNEFRKNEGGDTSYVKFGNNPQIDDNPYVLVPQTANSLYLGWTVAGEWTKYTVNVQQAGLYSINVMYTKPQPGTFSLSFNNQDLTGPLDLLSTFNAADTLDWRNWHHWNKATNVAQVRLAAGVQVMTLNININGNFDYADFVYVGP